MKTTFVVLALALTSAFADVSHLSGIQTILHEDGYHYDKPKVPFPPPNVQRDPLCRNGAPDSAYPDCCTNGGRGEFCCTNGLNVPGCQPPPVVNKKEEYLPPPSPPVQRDPLCRNGAPDSAYPDCCTNGGRGQFCCTNGLNVPGCQPPPPPTTTTRAPLCRNGAPDSAYPDCCTNGGRGQFCCTNGLNVPGCQPPPPPPPPVQRDPLCRNGAPDSAYPDCCTNGGRGQFCCTNGLNVPGCQPPQLPPKVNDDYLPPCGNGGTGPNCDTAQGYNYDKPSVAFFY